MWLLHVGLKWSFLTALVSCQAVTKTVYELAGCYWDRSWEERGQPSSSFTTHNQSRSLITCARDCELDEACREVLATSEDAATHCWSIDDITSHASVLPDACETAPQPVRLFRQLSRTVQCLNPLHVYDGTECTCPGLSANTSSCTVPCLATARDSLDRQTCLHVYSMSSNQSVLEDIPQQKTYAKAEAYCQSVGGTLLDIGQISDMMPLQPWLNQTISSNTFIWASATTDDTVNYYWPTGILVKGIWLAGEPNLAHENCTALMMPSPANIGLVDYACGYTTAAVACTVQFS